MTKKVIDNSNLGHLVSKAKAAFWPKEDVINVNLADVATSGDYNDLSNKPTIPDVSNFITKSVNDLTNYYLKSETYTKEEVAALIGAIQQFHYEIAASISAVTSPANNVLYLIGPTGSGADKYEEYVYDATKPVAERWIKIGDTSIDLSGYITTQALNAALAGKQDTLTFDTTPTENSTNPVTSGGIYNAITENEQVVAAALNDLNDRLNNIDIPDSEEMTSITYEELVALRDGNQLKPGHQYRITDYQCDTIAVNTRALNHQFDIIVTADSTNTLNESARAAQHDGENYFLGNDLSKWELKYILTPDPSLYNWAGKYGETYMYIDPDSNGNAYTYVRYNDLDENGYYCWQTLHSEEPAFPYHVFTDTENPTINSELYDGSEGLHSSQVLMGVHECVGKGLITYMKDDYNNVAFYDFKNIQFAKWIGEDLNGYITLKDVNTNAYTKIWCYTYSSILYDPSDLSSTEVYDITKQEDNTSYNYPSRPSYDNYVGPCAYTDWNHCNYHCLAEVVIYILTSTTDTEYQPYMTCAFVDSNYAGYKCINYNDSDEQGVICRFAPRHTSETIKNKLISSDRINISPYATDDQYSSAKVVYNTVHPQKSTSYPSEGFVANKPYFLGTITGSKTWALASPEDNYIMNHYFWTFETGATAPTITWPSGLTWPGGSPPAILPNKHYEISVLNNVVAWMEV